MSRFVQVAVTIEGVIVALDDQGEIWTADLDNDTASPNYWLRLPGHPSAQGRKATIPKPHGPKK